MSTSSPSVIGPPAALAQEAKDPPRVLYLLGAPRSGTTFLEAILGAHGDVVSVGELRFLLDEEHGKPRRCSCGELVPSCPFWRQVLDEWTRAIGDDERRAYRILRHHYERFRGWPRMAVDLMFRKKSLDRHSDATRALLTAVLCLSGRKLIADSSKTPARVFVFQRGHVADLHLVHMVRDPRAVAWSRLKAYEKRANRPPSPVRRALFVLRPAAHWLTVNAISEYLVRDPGKGIRIRYEDLATDPEPALAKISGLIGLDLSAIAKAARGGHAFEYGHLVGGNPRRFSGPASLELDEEWIRASPRWMQDLSWIVTWPLARRYGYRR